MKKILLLVSAVAAFLTVGACQKEISYLDGDTKVTFEVSTGDLATKATIADASNITVLHWELYGEDIRTAKTPFGEGTVRDNDGDKKFTVELRLVADQNYNIVFWAETDKGNVHYGTGDLRNVKINTYSDEYANDESRAAFFGVRNFKTENGVSLNEQVTLYRPFSQINLGATTYETSLNLINGGQVVVNSTEMTVNSIADSFNSLDGIGEVDPMSDGIVTFKAAPTPNGTADATQQLLEVGEDTYYWIGMNYLIVEGNSDAVNVDVTINTNMGVVSHSIENVPVKENYRTNIIGDFLTTGAEFEVIVDERFEQPDFIVDPNPVVNEKLYKVYNAEELAKYAYMVNKVDNTLECLVMQDIALPQFEIAEDAENQTYVFTDTPITVEDGVPSGSNWISLGVYYSGSPLFLGKVDGNGKTISGMRINRSEAVAGFVGYADTDAVTITDLTFDDAVVYSTSSYVGVVAGYARNGVTIKNCHCKDVTVTGAGNVGGIVGYNYTKAAGKVTSVEKCSVDAASVIKGTSNVGGIAGDNYGGLIFNSRNAAEVSGSSYVGGVAGQSRDYHHNMSGWVIASHNEGKVTGSSITGGIVGRSLADINHQNSSNYIVACSNTGVVNKNILVGGNTYTEDHYGSWGFKSSAAQILMPSGTYTACYAFASTSDVTEENVNAMNAAIDTYNAGKSTDDPTYCPYKWSWTAGNYPELK